MLLRFALIPSLLLGLASTPLTAQEAPPGLILVKGGKTKIGAKIKDVEELIKKHKQMASAFAAETPQHTVDVEDFYLMPTEVTNEQFAEFVRATGSKPPYYWSTGGDAARMAYLEAEGKLKQEARERGERYTIEKWEASEWWEKNWEMEDWEVPSDQLDSPVNFVNYHDAEAYARWAGLRLMTEQEFTRAARGSSDSAYPWGDDWDVAACNSNDFKEADQGIAVGSFPQGARDGIHDLIGNVWEWTSSPYKRFEDYEKLEVKVSRGETIRGMAPFDPSSRVMVGGAFVSPSYASRITVRRGAEKSQAAEAVGFRCAADLDPAVVSATWVVEEEVSRHLLPYSMKFAPERGMALQRWHSKSGTARVEGYAVITGFERVVFAPVDELMYSSKSDLGNWTSKNGPAFLGVVSIPWALADPLLDGGTYFVAWREAGKVDEPDEGQPQDDAWWNVQGFDSDVDSLILYDINGIPVVSMPAQPVEFERMKGPGTMVHEPFVMPEDLDPKEPPPVPIDTLRISIVIPGKSRKGLHTDILLKLEPGKIDASWK